MTRRRSKFFGKVFCLATAIVLMGALFSGLQAASTYPDQAITIIVPYPAGGVTDLSARALAEALEKPMKQPVVVVNKPGGRATIGGNAVVTANPDGYTLGFFPIATALPEVYTYFFEAPYTSQDFKPISCVAATAMSIVVRSDSPLKSIKDLVEYARKNPGLKIGTPGKQTLPYMVLVDIAKKEKVNFVDVPLGGDAKTTPALLGGHVPVAAIDYSAIKSHVEADKLRVLAICTPKRVDFAPKIPCMGELGYELAYFSVLGLFGQKNLPEAVVKKLDDEVGKIVKDPAFKQKMLNMSIQTYYEDHSTYSKSLAGYKKTMAAFFKEQGLVK